MQDCATLWIRPFVRPLIIAAAILLFFALGAHSQVYMEVREHGWGAGLDQPCPAIADIDGNGKMDMLVGSYAGYILRYEMAEPGGDVFRLLERRFLRVPRPAYGAIPILVDLDNNGRLDLIVGSSHGSFFHYEQTSRHALDFTLVTQKLLELDASLAKSPIIGDLEGDGRLDLLFFDYPSQLRRYTQVAPNSRQFEAGKDVSLTGVSLHTHPSGQLRDIDHDGRLELLLSDGWMEPLLFRADANVKDSFLFVAQGLNGIENVTEAGMCLEDVDSDGLLDILLVVGGKLSQYEQTSADAVNFSKRIQSDVLGLFNFTRATGFAVADLDKDGRYDILRFSHDGWLTGDPLMHYRQKAVGGLELELVTNRVDGIISEATSTPVLTDLDEDGLLDLLILTPGKQGSRHYRQKADNPFAFEEMPARFLPDLSFEPSTHMAASFIDLDADGALDMFLASTNGRVHHLKQRSGGSVGFDVYSESIFQKYIGRGYPQFYDLDGDGLIECLFGSSSGTIQLFRQSSLRSLDFIHVTDSLGGIAVLSGSSVAVVDMNRDGKPDLLVADEAGGFSLFLNNTPVSVAQPAAFPGHRATLDINPHPVHDHSELRISIPTEVTAAIRVLDLLGREVLHIADGLRLQPGLNTLRLNSDALQDGCYLLVMEAGSVRLSRAIVIMR